MDLSLIIKFTLLKSFISRILYFNSLLMINHEPGIDFKNMALICSIYKQYAEL